MSGFQDDGINAMIEYSLGDLGLRDHYVISL